VARGYRGLFDVPAVLSALHRGASCKEDLREFDLFPHQDRALDDVRAELGIPPLAPAAPLTALAAAAL
jgi:hypothetical protein